MSVLARWGLLDALVEPVDSGATNQTSRITRNRNVWFLRKYRTTDRHAVQREHELIARARAAGVRTPRPIPAADAETVVEAEGALFALFEAADGEQLEPSEMSLAHAAAAGAFLAHVHDAIADVPVAAFRRVTLDWDGPAWAARVRATAALIPQDSADDVDRWAHRRSIEQAQWLEHPDCRHHYIPTSPIQVIHGDYQHANLFFRGSGVAAVIDWDTAAATCRGFEVVRACAFMFPLDGDRTRAFVAAYRDVSPLTADELGDGAIAWGCFSDHHVWPMEERYRNGNRAAERFIPHRPFEPFEEVWNRLDVD